MGKYASKDVDSGMIVTWTNVSGKPSTFAPTTHSNTAHSTAYAPVNSPAFTGMVKSSGAGLATVPVLGSAVVGANAVLSSDGLYGIYTGIKGSGDVWMQVQRNDGDAAVYNLLLQPMGGNVIASGSIIASKLQTANFSWEEDAGAFVLKYGSTIIARFSNAGLLKTKADQQVDSSI